MKPDGQRKKHRRCEHGLGCITCKDLAEKNGLFMLGERRTCPDGLDYGHIPGTGLTTCQFDCDICLDRDTEESNQLKNIKPAAKPAARSKKRFWCTKYNNWKRDVRTSSYLWP
jgi:hypothetical protein